MGLITWIKKTWAKTIFPEKIRKRKEKKRLLKERKYEENKYINKIKHEAKIEAMHESKGALKAKYKKQFVANISKPQKSKMQKFADAMSIGGNGNKNFTSKIGNMGGSGYVGEKATGRMPGGKVKNLGGNINMQDKLDSMLGNKTKTNINTKKNITLMTKQKGSYEDKVKKFLGR